MRELKSVECVQTGSSSTEMSVSEIILLSRVNEMAIADVSCFKKYVLDRKICLVGRTYKYKFIEL